jgi:hypothetical protein
MKNKYENVVDNYRKLNEAIILYLLISIESSGFPLGQSSGDYRNGKNSNSSSASPRGKANIQSTVEDLYTAH